MPFEQGKATPGAGRKGYEIEQAQLETMRRILDRDLKMVEKLQNQEEIDEKTKKKLDILQTRISKYLDKLHIPKVDITTKGDKINMNPEVLQIAKEYEEKLNKLEDESRKDINQSVDSESSN